MKFAPMEFCALCLLVAALSACGGGTEPGGKDKPPAPAAKERLSIACTTPIIHEILLKIVGDRADVVCLMPTGAAPQAFDLRPGGVQMIQSADLVFTHGLKLEGAILETIVAHADASRIIELADGPLVRGRARRATEILGPSAWIRPRIYTLMVGQARDALSEADSKNKAHYAAQAEAYVKEINDLSTWIVATVPQRQTDTGGIITNRAVLVELAQNINQRAHLHAIDVGRTPTIADRDQLLVAVKEFSIRAIAIDPDHNEALAEMLVEIAKATGARVVSPAMSDWPRNEEDSYIRMMKANVQTLVEALK